MCAFARPLHMAPMLRFLSSGRGVSADSPWVDLGVQRGPRLPASGLAGREFALVWGSRPSLVICESGIWSWSAVFSSSV